MSRKTKNTLKLPDTVTEISRQAGVLLMAAAVTFGMMDHSSTRVILPAQAAITPAGENEAFNNSSRRESEETAPHYVSYSETQRTPSRSGQ